MIRAFVISIFIISILVIVFASFNINYYDAIRKNPTSTVTATDAETMMWLFIIGLLPISILGFLWSGYLMLTSFTSINNAVSGATSKLGYTLGNLRDRAKAYALGPIDKPKM